MHIEVQLAAHTAVRTGGSCFDQIFRFALANGGPLVKRACRAGAHALTAHLAGRLLEFNLKSGGDLHIPGTSFKGQCLDHLYFGADLHAALAEDTFRGVVKNSLIAGRIILSSGRYFD